MHMCRVSSQQNVAFTVGIGKPYPTLPLGMPDQITQRYAVEVLIHQAHESLLWRDIRIGRFATMEEDEAPTHLLVSDYATWLT